MNRALVCVDCKRDFVFEEKEQAIYAKHSFPDPIRCKKCRKVVKEKRSARKAEMDELKPKRV